MVVEVFEILFVFDFIIDSLAAALVLAGVNLLVEALLLSLGLLDVLLQEEGQGG